MPRGIKQLSEATANMPTGGTFFKHVRLYDDQESAIIRFLTEADEVFWGPFHRVMRHTQKGVQYWENVFCVGELGQTCEYCREDSSVSIQFLAWVYQYKMYHAKQVEGSRQVDVNGLIRYEEENNEVRLMRYSHMHKGGIEMRLQRYGSLTDRVYEWIRTGVRGTNRPTYMLEPVGDPTEMPAELAELAKSLPDLEDIAMGKVRSLDGKTSDGQKLTRTATPSANKQVVDVGKQEEEEGLVQELDENTGFDLNELGFASEGPPSY